MFTIVPTFIDQSSKSYFYPALKTFIVFEKNYKFLNKEGNAVALPSCSIITIN